MTSALHRDNRNLDQRAATRRNAPMMDKVQASDIAGVLAVSHFRAYGHRALGGIDQSQHSSTSSYRELWLGLQPTAPLAKAGAQMMAHGEHGLATETNGEYLWYHRQFHKCAHVKTIRSRSGDICHGIG